MVRVCAKHKLWTIHQYEWIEQNIFLSRLTLLRIITFRRGSHFWTKPEPSSIFSSTSRDFWNGNLFCAKWELRWKITSWINDKRSKVPMRSNSARWSTRLERNSSFDPNLPSKQMPSDLCKLLYDFLSQLLLNAHDIILLLRYDQSRLVQ